MREQPCAVAKDFQFLPDYVNKLLASRIFVCFTLPLRLSAKAALTQPRLIYANPSITVPEASRSSMRAMTSRPVWE